LNRYEGIRQLSKSEYPFDHLFLEVLPPASPKLNRGDEAGILIIQVGPVKDSAMIEAGEIFYFPGGDIAFFVDAMSIGVEEQVQLLLNSG